MLPSLVQPKRVPKLCFCDAHLHMYMQAHIVTRDSGFGRERASEYDGGAVIDLIKIQPHIAALSALATQRGNIKKRAGTLAFLADVVSMQT